MLENNLIKTYQPKYNIAFEVKTCNSKLLELLEPWCDGIYIDDDMQVLTSHYIDQEQKNTLYDLEKRIFRIGHNDPEGENDIIVTIDRKTFTDYDYQLIQNLSAIIQDSGEPGTFRLNNLDITIISKESYVSDLIVCK